MSEISSSEKQPKKWSRRKSGAVGAAFLGALGTAPAHSAERVPVSTVRVETGYATKFTEPELDILDHLRVGYETLMPGESTTTVSISNGALLAVYGALPKERQALLRQEASRIEKETEARIKSGNTGRFTSQTVEEMTTMFSISDNLLEPPTDKITFTPSMVNQLTGNEIMGFAEGILDGKPDLSKRDRLAMMPEVQFKTNLENVERTAAFVQSVRAKMGKDFASLAPDEQKRIEGFTENMLERMRAEGQTRLRSEATAFLGMITAASPQEVARGFSLQVKEFIAQKQYGILASSSAEEVMKLIFPRERTKLLSVLTKEEQGKLANRYKEFVLEAHRMFTAPAPGRSASAR